VPTARAAFRLIRTMPSIPQVSVEGTPKLFIMDIALLPRGPFVLQGRVAYPDWPVL